MSTRAHGPSRAVPPAVIGPCSGTTPSLSATTRARVRSGGSVSVPSQVGTARPSESSSVAPGPAAWAARAAAGSNSRPSATRPSRRAPARAATSACNSPVVFASPPAPGLSWVSAMTTGRSAPAASAIADSTASRGASRSIDHRPRCSTISRVQLLHRAAHAQGVGAMAEDDRAALGEVGGREAHRETELDVLCRLDPAQLLDDRRGRLHQRALRVQRQQEGHALRVRVPRGRLAFEPGREHLRGTRARLAHVDMGIGAERRHRIGQAQHARRHVGMQVQARDDRQAVADDGAQPLQQFALGIVMPFGDCRAVQVEVDRVEAVGRGVAQIRDDLAGDALERVGRDAVARHRAGPERRPQRPAAFLRRLGEPADRHAAAAHLVEHRRTARAGRVARAGLERSPVGRRGREGVGLVVEAGDEDRDHGHALRSRRGAASARGSRCRPSSAPARRCARAPAARRAPC